MEVHDQQRRPTAAAQVSGLKPWLVRTAQVRGVAVLGTDDEPLGRIADIVIDKSTGRVARVLISVGGFMGLGRRLRSAPWSALRYDATRRAYLAACRGADLEPAPSGELSGWAARRGAREADLYAACPFLAPPF